MTEEIKVHLLDWWGADRDIAESAWVSTANNQKERPDSDVKRVIENSIVPDKHQTPKESVWMKFYMKVPIYVERQFDKYRMTIQQQDMTLTYEQGDMSRWGITQNELSLRYRTMPNGYLPLPNDVNSILEKANLSWAADKYNDLMEQQYTQYDEIVKSLKASEASGNITMSELKRVREVYRGILGTASFTDMQIICNLNALEHILSQRLSIHAQPEAYEAARLMLKEVVDNKILPVTIQAMMNKYNWKI